MNSSKRLIHAILAFFILAVFAAPSYSIGVTGAGAAQLLVRSFEMWDDLGLDFTFGRYENTTPCGIGPTGFPDCVSNGYFHVDTVSNPTFNATGMEAVYFFDGPAFDQSGALIPGTEDDRLKVTAILESFNTNTFPAQNGFRIREVQVEGSSLEFVNGVSFTSLSFSFSQADDQQFGEGLVLFTDPSEPLFNGFFKGVPDPSTSMVDDLFKIHYQQEYEATQFRPLVNVNLPEPEFYPLLLSGIVGLGMMHAITHRRKRNRAAAG